MADMQKVETLPLADYQVKISDYRENQSPLVEFMISANFWKVSASAAMLLGCFCMFA